MTSILDTAFLLGEESTYGIPAALTRAYEAKNDRWNGTSERLESQGFRAGNHTLRSDRRRAINLGGSGSVELDLMNKGMGLALQAALGNVTGPTADVITLTTDSTLPTTSFTAQVLRPDSAGTLIQYTYPGSVVTGWSLSQATNGFPSLTLDYDSQDEEIATAAGTPTYVADAVPYDWTQLDVSFNSSALDNVTSFDITADLGVKTDRHFLRGSRLKKVPCRVGAPTITGTLTSEMDDSSLFSIYKTGAIFDLTLTYTGDSWGGGTYSFVIDMPACQFDGDTPVAAMGDMTMQTMPFRVLHDGTNPAVTITITSDDSTL